MARRRRPMEAKMNQNDTLSDLAYVRTLAEAGRTAPLLSGPHLMGWGALLSGALASHGLIVNTLPTEQHWTLWAVWGAFATAGLGLNALLGRRLRSRPGASAANNQADGAIWAGAGLVMGAFAIGMLGHMLYTQDWTAPNAIPAASFAVYGGAMLASSLVSGVGLLRPFAILAALFAVALAVFADTPWTYYVAAGGALVTLFAPGLALARREPATTV